MTVKIVFRGLLVFNHRNGAMEIGAMYHRHDAAILSQHDHPVHIPRIITTKNGVITSVFDLRTRPELQPRGVPGHVRNWEIAVTNPAQPNVTMFTDGTNWNRRGGQHHPRDFRWLSHLDGADLHGNIADLQGNKLVMVLKVQNGEFYTEQLSKPLLRKIVTNAGNGREDAYGRAAEVTGCDIRTIPSAGAASPPNGEAQLKVNGNIVFKFKGRLEDGVVYEFSNAPPDALPHRAYSPNEPGHFRQYHNLFGQGAPFDRFDLVPEVDLAPAPDPALCGATRVTPNPGGF